LPIEDEFSDIEKLRVALLRLQFILDDIVNEPERVVSPRLLEKSRAAWPEIRRAFDRALDLVFSKR
jgi:hypothetical protein